MTNINISNLIGKQQLEIEELKATVASQKCTLNEVRCYLLRPEQWNPKCPDFPKVAMNGIVKAIRAIDDI